MEGRRRFSVHDDDETEEIKKGPWKPEEDRVLINHVRKYGPRDWSSIRSKGLLQRTGKSCRLRWVNKLRPNLKSGVKFSAEEERTVIDLQAQFGNKWAKIATYLAGRTDNDVKNFWSSRRKRLARILETAPRPPSSSIKSRKFNNTKENKAPFSDIEAPKFISSTKLQESMKSLMSCSSSQIPDFETIRSVPLLELAYPSGLNYENIPFFNPHPQYLSVPLIPQLQPVFPSPTEYQELVGEPNFFDDFGHSSGSALGTPDLPIAPPSFLGPHTSSSQLISGHNVDTPDSLVDDFPPIDMFYHIEPLPSPSDWS